MKHLDKITLLSVIPGAAILVAMGLILFNHVQSENTALPVPFSAAEFNARAAVSYSDLPTVSNAPVTEAEFNPRAASRPAQLSNLWQLSSQEERDCMALNIYHEARGEPILGQIAVAQVTLNRMELDDYPDTVCAVVWQPWQFSWTMDTISDTPRDAAAWLRSQQVARSVMQGWGQAFDVTGGADHYHAYWVNPAWANANRITTVIGVHTFYRLRS